MNSAMVRLRIPQVIGFACLYDKHRPIAVRFPAVAAPGGSMHLIAELIGGAVTLVGLGILTLASIRSIGRRGPSARG
ncbi:hypothetical protein [Streptomyces sp. NPDC017890]|uniref:hypothetical protein n=1 Tax=Streptomyces sp. NPDC017890 TaxID=3365015 RepID=UPI0037BD01B0